MQPRSAKTTQVRVFTLDYAPCRVRSGGRAAVFRNKGFSADESCISRIRRVGGAAFGIGRRRCGAGPKAGRDIAGLSPRQPGQHVDPRGGDGRRHHADDGCLQ